MVEELIKEIIRSKRRTIALQITPKADLIVRAPRKAPLDIIHRFVREKLPWILEKQRFVRENCRPPVEKRFVEGESFLYLGQSYKLSIARETNEPLVFNGSEFLLWEKYLSAGRNVFEWWYRRQARKIITERAAFYANSAGLKFTRLKITSARTRLGSCSTKGTINFSWRLILTPMEVVDYVVAHEIAHLKEHNHSKRFWHNVQILNPNYKQARLWQKTNGRLLTI